MHSRLWFLTVLVLALAGCGEQATSTKPTPEGAKTGTEPQGRRDAPMKVTSPAFESGERVPQKHTGEADDVAPALEWVGAPEGTREFALICDDPDAPTPKPWVHWVLYKIPTDCTSLAEGNPGRALEGKNDFGDTGYGGPMPPRGHGVHHYHFKLYALDAELDLKPGATKEQVLAAMKGHILAQGELIGTYERK